MKNLLLFGAGLIAGKLVFAKKPETQTVSGLSGKEKKYETIGFEYSGRMSKNAQSAADEIAETCETIEEAWEKVYKLKNKFVKDEIIENGSFVGYGNISGSKTNQSKYKEIMIEFVKKGDMIGVGYKNEPRSNFLQIQSFKTVKEILREGLILITYTDGTSVYIPKSERYLYKTAWILK